MRSKTQPVIGITGGIGSGKSIVCRIFRILGIPVYDADFRARYLQNNDNQLKAQIIGLLGEDAYSNDELDNKWIAARIFKDQEILGRLNDLVHPKVANDFEEWRKEKLDSSYLIKEAALLFEAGSYKSLDKLVVVTAPESLRIKRVLARDPHRTEEQVKEIMKRQWPQERKLSLADFVINNDEAHLLTPQVLDLHRTFSRVQS